jgi:hypothetical protein
VRQIDVDAVRAQISVMGELHIISSKPMLLISAGSFRLHPVLRHHAIVTARGRRL